VGLQRRKVEGKRNQRFVSTGGDREEEFRRSLELSGGVELHGLKRNNPQRFRKWGGEGRLVGNLSKKEDKMEK